jgi:hypothetical protein
MEGIGFTQWNQHNVPTLPLYLGMSEYINEKLSAASPLRRFWKRASRPETEVLLMWLP